MLEVAQTLKIYSNIKGIFSHHPETTIDIQTDFVEMIQMAQTVMGTKPSFLSFLTRDGCKPLFEELVSALPISECIFGFNDISAFKPYRPFKITDSQVEQEIIKKFANPLPVFWLTTEKRLADAYESGDAIKLGEQLLLGYPTCCASWHYDCYFARGIEAFYDVYLRQMSTAEICSYIRDGGWAPSSGWFLPRNFFLAGVLRGNQAFPFIDHVACPKCLANNSSPSAKMNVENAKLATLLDSEMAEAVRKWAADLSPTIKSLLAHPRRTIDDEMNQYGLNVRARDIYGQHGRYLFKQLGF